MGAALAAGEIDEPEALDRLHAELGGLHWVHTLNNAALIACALEAAGGSIDRGIAIAVAGGWDTDSAGATVGSVLGALGGFSGIGAAWTEPSTAGSPRRSPAARRGRSTSSCSARCELPERMSR